MRGRGRGGGTASEESPYAKMLTALQESAN